MTRENRTTLERLSVQLNGVQDLNLKHLYYFHHVATQGTIARAAKHLGLSPATVSEQLKNLEDYLGHSLLERRSTGVRLNQQGRRLFDHTSAMFRTVNRMLQDVSPDRFCASWTLEMGICPTISSTLAMKRFMPLFRFERVKLRVRTGGYDSMMQALLNREIDLVLSENMPTEIEQEQLGTKTIAESPLVFVANADMAKLVEDFPSDLGKLPLLNYTSSSRYRREVDNYLLDEGVAPDTIGEVDDITLIATAVEHGLCVGALPRSVVRPAAAEGKLVELGPVNGSSSYIYAHFASVKTPDIVTQAIEALTADAS